MPPSQSVGASVPNPSEFHLIHFLPRLSSLFPFFSPSLSLLAKMADCLDLFKHQDPPESI